ncbi:MAG: PRC-barrel domain-containing protein [Armatimonadota bacterium]|jgi:uncharacterized protein YrrD/ElaB/YqjD/DUF883 family membrane-anchored ribosome-binding protein
MRELTSLIGLQVISTSEGKRLGSIADVYVDLAAGELVCVTLAKTPELRVILAGDIDVIGDDAVMVSDHEKLRGREEVAEELVRGKRVLSSPPAVVTNQGKTLGQLGSVQIDEGTKKVVRFEVTHGPVRDVTEGVLALPILEGIVHGEDTVIVPHDVVAGRLVQAGGLRGALRNLGERLKVGVEDIGERSGDFVRDSEQKIKERAEEARKKAAEATEKAKKRVGEVADEAKEATEKAKKRMGEAAEDAREAVEDVKERAEEVAEDAKEATADAVEQADEVAEDVSEAIEGDEAPEAAEPAEGETDEGEVHMVPETATPLPPGEETAEGEVPGGEAAETAAEDTNDEDSSDDDASEETNQREAW